jgi:glycosyltransferase involved in cell wall biosynthesis
MTDAEQAALVARVAAHPNVVLQPRTHDMRQVYRATHILLAPSQWEEAWGRVATEAQFSGIPVLASDRGGLPEAVGPGGSVLPHDAPATVWAEALREYWRDPAVYQRASAAALDYARRPEIDPQRQVRDLTAILADSVRKAPRAAIRMAG